MATLIDFFTDNPKGYSLLGMVKDHRLINFLETGTGLGDTIMYVKDCFRWKFSIECNYDLYIKAASRFSDPTIQIINGYSNRMLGKLIYERAIQEPTMFFLDAHFPGADFHLASYEDEKDDHSRLPLYSEIRQIIEFKNFRRDIFIIDDLWFYEQGDFVAGKCPLPEKILGKAETIEKISRHLSLTHIVERDYRYQGFLVYLPKYEKKG